MSALADGGGSLALVSTDGGMQIEDDVEWGDELIASNAYNTTQPVSLNRQVYQLAAAGTYSGFDAAELAVSAAEWWATVAGMINPGPSPVLQAAAGTRRVGGKRYELTDHLGNVRAVISDVRRASISGNVVSFAPDVKSFTDYYAFGGEISGRKFNSGDYRFGFNGKENDPETGYQDYGMRGYNPQLCRFFRVDPIADQYPELTPYQFASNTPIQAIDLDGLEKLQYNEYRNAMLNAVPVLDNVAFPSGDPNVSFYNLSVYANNPFWTVGGRRNDELQLKEGMKPSDAINDIINNPRNYEFDCAVYSQALRFIGMLNSLGAENFDDFIADQNEPFTLRKHKSTGQSQLNAMYTFLEGKWWTSSAEDALRKFDPEKAIAEAPIGTRVVIKTPALEGTNYRSENIVKVGDNSFIAQGLNGGQTGAVMSLQLVREALILMAIGAGITREEAEATQHIYQIEIPSATIERP